MATINRPTSSGNNPYKMKLDEGDINSFSVFVPDLQMVRKYPKPTTDDEVDYDVHVNVRQNPPEDYYLNHEPNVMLLKAWKAADSYMKHGQQAMKLLATAPDVALGFSKDISPEELEKTYKSWYDLWRESPVGKKVAVSQYAPEELAKNPGLYFVPWFAFEFLPSEVIEAASKPSTYVTMYSAGKVMQKFGPRLMNKLVQKLPKSLTKERFLGEIFRTEKALAPEFETLGIRPNAPMKDVKAAYRNQSLKAHPDRGGSGEKMTAVNDAYTKIMRERTKWVNKFYRLFQESSLNKPAGVRPKLNLSSESGMADLVPFNEGDLAKIGKDVVKILKISGESALVNQAGKQVMVALKQLKPYEVENPEKPAGNKPGDVVKDKAGKPIEVGEVPAVEPGKEKWSPLDKIIQPQYKGKLMFMGTSEDFSPGTKPIISLFKHKDTRRYLNVDEEGNTYKYAGGKYVQVSPKKAIKDVYEDTADMAWKGESAYSEDFKPVSKAESGNVPDYRVPKFKSTEQAEAFGAAANSEQVKEMKDLMDMNEVRLKELRAKGENRTDAEDAEALALASEQQLLKEGLKKVPPPLPKPMVNTKNLDVTPEGEEALKKATAEISDEIEQGVGKRLTHNEVLDKAAQVDALTKQYGRAEMENLFAQVTNARERLAYLANKNELTPEFIEALKVVKSAGMFFGRGLESQKIFAKAAENAPMEKIVSKMIDLGNNADEILTAAEGVDFNDAKQVADFYRSKVPASFWEQLDEYAYMNILSSPKTHLVNILSTAANVAAVRPATIAATAMVESVGKALFGTTKKVFLSDVPKYYQGFFSAAPQAFAVGSDIMAGKVFAERPDVTAHLPTQANWIKYATFGLGKYVLRALEAEDVVLRAMAEAGERAIMMARQTGEVSPEELKAMNQEARRISSYMVFRSPLDPLNETGQGQLLSDIDRLTSLVYSLRSTSIGGVPIFPWFIRFVQTPMNIVKQGIEGSPLGFATLYGNTNKSEQIGKAMLGSLVFAAGSALAMNGRVTWAFPKNAKDRDVFHAAGMQPYSINVAPEGEKPVWVSFSKAVPAVAFPLAMSAALHYYWQESPAALSDSVMAKLVKSMGGMMQFFGDQSYVEPLGNLFKMINGEPQAMGNLFSGLPEQMIPLSSLQGWVNTILDPYYRKPARGFTLESIGDRMQKKFIGTTPLVPTASDLTGMPAKNKHRVINSFLPTPLSEGNPEFDNLYRELQKHRQLENKMNEDQETIKKKLQDELAKGAKK